MRHKNRKANKRKLRRGRSAKPIGIPAAGLLSLFLTGTAAPADHSFFIFDRETSRMPGLRMAQAKRSGGRSGIRSGIRSGARGSGLRRSGAPKAPTGVAGGRRGGFLKAAPTDAPSALNASPRDPAIGKK